MSDLLIRNISPASKRLLERRASENGRSQQAEALDILETGLRQRSRSMFRILRSAAESVGGVDLPQPERHVPRGVSLEEWL